MRKSALLFGIVFLIAFVSATVNVENHLRYGIIEDDGYLTMTNTHVNNVKVIGFVCASSNCVDVNDELFDGQTLDSQSQSDITLEYPTNLQSPHGYGVYFYKDQYIPFEVLANHSGNGNANDEIVYLSRKRNCVVPINDIDISDAGSNLNVVVDVSSPLDHAGPLGYVPAQIDHYYEARVKVEIDVNSESEVLSRDIPFSQDEQYSFSLPKEDGNNSISVRAFTTESFCLYSPVSEQNTSFFVGGNESDLPPTSVSNLRPVEITNSSIKWQWDNPNDSDFSHAIVYLDGVNVANTSGNMYLATGLLANTSHTIVLNTADDAGNVNANDVSSTATTLDNDGSDNLPPASISNLGLVNKSHNFIKWNWTNPSNADFSMAIIFINGANVANITGNMYTASGLNENTLYTITVHTKDFFGNVNDTDISNTQRTDSLDDNNDDNDDDNDSLDPRVEQPVNVQNVTFNDYQDKIIVRPQKSKIDYSWLIVLLLMAIILVVILIILLAMGKKE